MIKSVARRLFPRKIYNFIRMRPRVIIVSESLKRKIAYINRAGWAQDPDYRGDNSGALRKYGHMIDKGLQSPQREAGHSILVANRLAELLREYDDYDVTFEWAKTVLSLHSDLQNEQLGSKYSNFAFESTNSITAESLLGFMKERRSLRHFSQTKLPSPAELNEVLQASIWAPSSCNRQTIVNYFSMDEGLVIECTKQNKGATSISGKYCFVSVCFDTRSYHLPQESLTGYIDASLGFQNSLLMAHAKGLGACVLNWSHATAKENAKLRELLRIPEYCEIAFNVIVGVPDGGAPIPGKKKTSEFIIER